MMLAAKRRLLLLLAAGLLGGGAYLGFWYRDLPDGAVSEQTDVDRAVHRLDRKGVPLLDIAGLGEHRHPAWIALYALAYADKEAYNPSLVGQGNPDRFEACIDWLATNLKQNSAGLWVWTYDFDSTYNDIGIKAPWSSAFAQATGIQALVEAHRRSGQVRYLELARKAAEALWVPLEKGGFLYEAGDEVWFEEIPVPHANPGHILNGHMRALLALQELEDATGDVQVARWLQRGMDTLYRWLPLYDAGYWLRYDLNPQKKELLFRLANPYGFENLPLAVDRIRLKDPVSGREISLDVGAIGDAEGSQRIAGTHWGQIENLEGRSVRRLVPAVMDTRPDQMGAPHSYFYLALPDEWRDNLRSEWFELSIDYLDEAQGAVVVEQRTIAPGRTFREMRDGQLHLTGGKVWRTWTVPLRPADLGYWVGQTYAEKHREYLEKIARKDERFAAWAYVARGYERLALPPRPNPEAMDGGGELPKQTPMVPIFSLDRDGVVRPHKGDAHTKWHASGTFDPSGGRGTPTYSPFVVAQQLRLGNKMPGVDESIVASTRIDRSLIKREPALRWLLDERNYRRVGAAAIYPYPFDNAYNDVAMQAPWASAFGQAYVLEALLYAYRSKLADNLLSTIRAVVAAFEIPVSEGGVMWRGRNGLPFFEEVPNGSHILNGHLISLASLASAAGELDDTQARNLELLGRENLRNQLHRYDTGYWLRYDQNPKKNLLFQIDWLEGENSPLIDVIFLENPATGSAVELDVGRPEDMEGLNRLSGTVWQVNESAGESRTVRAFGNHYLARTQPETKLGSQTFVFLQLPQAQWSDFFDSPVHRLTVRYKDVAKARLVLKVQSVHEGSRAEFVPLRPGVWELQGDQQWKEISFEVRPQDLGWFKGADYQRYEVEQLQKLAERSGDWFFSQYALRHGDYLRLFEEGRTLVPVPTFQSPAYVPGPARVVATSPTVDGYGFDNALDGDPNDDYTAGLEGAEHYVTLQFDRPTDLGALYLTWESRVNYASRVTVSRVDGSETKVLGQADGLLPTISRIPLGDARGVQTIRVDFSGFAGQQRTLLRQLRFAVPEGSVAARN